MEKLDFRYKLEVKKFGRSDSEPNPDDVKVFKTIIEECDDKYPGIDLWFDKKVIKGLKEKERSGILLFHGTEIIGASVNKKGKDAKLCSLRIKPDFENSGLGTLLMALSIFELRNSESIHFTIPESLWDEKRSFFKKYGFSFEKNIKKVYRTYEDELICRGSFGDAWKYIVNNIKDILDTLSINKNNGFADLIVSIKPEYADKIIKGEKTVEIRRRFSDKWEGANILIYSSNPVQGIIGEAKISKIVKRNPNDIWFEFGGAIGCDRETFFKYSEGTEKISALLLTDIRPFNMEIPINFINKLHPDKKEISAPQSHSSIDDEYFYPITIFYDTLLKTRF